MTPCGASCCIWCSSSRRARRRSSPRAPCPDEMLGLFLRGVLAVAIIAAGLVVGEQLRATREQLAQGQAASAGTPIPTTQPVTPAPKPTVRVSAQPQPTAPPAARTVVPTPVSTPFTGVPSVVSGTVTVGGKPVRAAQVMVYPSNSFNFSITAMPLTLRAQASGLTGEAWATMDLDLRADRTDLVLTIDRGNIVGGTLRDAAGRPLPNTNFGVWSGDAMVFCTSCGGRSDGAGRFTITIPSGTVHFKNWPQVGEPELSSKDYVISGDLTLDPVLQVH